MFLRRFIVYLIHGANTLSQALHGHLACFLMKNINGSAETACSINNAILHVVNIGYLCITVSGNTVCLFPVLCGDFIEANLGKYRINHLTSACKYLFTHITQDMILPWKSLIWVSLQVIDNVSHELYPRLCCVLLNCFLYTCALFVNFPRVPSNDIAEIIPSTQSAELAEAWIKWRSFYKHFEMHFRFSLSFLSVSKFTKRYSMMTPSDGNIFRGTGPLCGEFTGHRWIPLTKASDSEFFYLHLNKRLSKQSWGWWFETPSRLLWRHCNA